MADANTTDVKPAAVDAPKVDTPPKAKDWSDDEVQKIIAERDAAKKKAREAQAKIDADDEAKKIAEGKKDEVIEELRGKLKPLQEFYDARTEQDKKEREVLLAELPDEFKAEAEGMSLNAMRLIVNTTKSRQLNQDRGKKTPGDADDLAIKKGEDVNSYNQRVLRRFPLTQ